MSRPGKPIKNKTPLLACIALTFYPGVSYLCVFGVNGDGFFFSSAIGGLQIGYERSEFPFCFTRPSWRRNGT
jgi:hypothetical protein